MNWEQWIAHQEPTAKSMKSWVKKRQIRRWKQGPKAFSMPWNDLLCGQKKKDTQMGEAESNELTHHLYIWGHSGQKVQQLVVINDVRVSQLLGEFIHSWKEEKGAVGFKREQTLRKWHRGGEKKIKSSEEKVTGDFLDTLESSTVKQQRGIWSVGHINTFDMNSPQASTIYLKGMK